MGIKITHATGIKITHATFVRTNKDETPPRVVPVSMVELKNTLMRIFLFISQFRIQLKIYKALTILTMKNKDLLHQGE